MIQSGDICILFSSVFTNKHYVISANNGMTTSSEEYSEFKLAREHYISIKDDITKVNTTGVALGLACIDIDIIETDFYEWSSSKAFNAGRLAKYICNIVASDKVINKPIIALLPPKDSLKVSQEFEKTVRWLSRPSVRLYAKTKGDTNTMAYSIAWEAANYTDFMSGLLPSSEPVRDVAILRKLRMSPTDALNLPVVGLLLVYFTKLMPEIIDASPSASVWMSTVELMAVMKGNSKTKFRIEDVLIFKMSKTSAEKRAAYLSENTSLIFSHSFGCASKSILNEEYKGTWLSCWVRCLERARWVSIIYSSKLKDLIKASGYGDGVMTFYCKDSNIDEVNTLLREQAAILRFDNKDDASCFEAEIKAEV